MIAEVYPLRRMSRSMPFLDYLIPDDLQLKRGALVEIPFRTKKTVGIVRQVKNKAARGIRLKTIQRIIDEQALSDQELSFFEKIARDISQPVATLLYVYFPYSGSHAAAPNAPAGTCPPLTVPAQEAPTIARIASQLSERQKAFAQISDIRRAAAVIAGYMVLTTHKKIVILCPRVHDVQILKDALGSFHPLALTGEESRGQRADVWNRFRHCSQAMLLTTGVGMFFPDQKTMAIFVIHSGHPDHVLHDRNPRLDAREVVRDFAHQTKTRLYFLDAFPRAEDLFVFGPEHILVSPIPHPPLFIDAGHERPGSAHPILTSSCLNAIESALAQQQRVFLIYNKKGYARRLRCESCGSHVVCQHCQHLLRILRSTVQCIACDRIEPIPVRCPSCQHPRLTARGYGMDRLQESVSEFFPKATCQMIDAEHLEQPHADICIVTRAYLEGIFNPLKKEVAGCVIHLDPDTALFSSDFRASQRAVWSLAQWQGLAHALQAPFFIQTDENDWFNEQLSHPEMAIAQELARRHEYQQPPWTHWILVRLKETETRKRELESSLLKETLERIPTVRVSQPATERIDETLLQIRLNHEDLEAVLQVFSSLDDRYIIDTNAYRG